MHSVAGGQLAISNLLIKAQQKYLRISPRKLKPIAGSIRHLSPGEALVYLQHLNKRGVLPMMKVIKQAIANARQKDISEKDLKFSSIQILKGPTYKRWRPVSRGKAHRILKRTSHIKVILKIKNQISKTQIKNKKEEKK